MALSKLALALAVAPSAALVAPSAKAASTKLAAEGKLDEIPEAENRFTSRLATQEGFCLDLPGALAPMGQWDPAGFTSQASDNDIRRYREAETQHGRVAAVLVCRCLYFLVALQLPQYVALVVAVRHCGGGPAERCARSPQ